MVRLKAVNQIRVDNFINIFQFHYGTIKRELAASTIQKVYNFNSTMVRLKDKFKHGRNPLRFYFNSTMVRLKACNVFLVVLRNFSFQFHYGTIKRNSGSRH